MVNKINDGGPAFPLYVPTQQAGDNSEVILGLSLRDYFAAKAMQGILANHQTYSLKDDTIAMYAFNIADAMIKERNK